MHSLHLHLLPFDIFPRRSHRLSHPFGIKRRQWRAEWKEFEGGWEQEWRKLGFVVYVQEEGVLHEWNLHLQLIVYRIKISHKPILVILCN